MNIALLNIYSELHTEMLTHALELINGDVLDYETTTVFDRIESTRNEMESIRDQIIAESAAPDTAIITNYTLNDHLIRAFIKAYSAWHAHLSSGCSGSSFIGLCPGCNTFREAILKALAEYRFLPLDTP